MIKDSKLIGTKIVAPFGWKKFKVGELFDVQSTSAVNYDDLISNGKYPYVVRSANNNGIRDYMSGDLAMLNKGGCITLGIDTASYFYQDCDKFFAGVKVKALYLVDHKLSETIALYLIECLSRYVTGYGYAGGKPFKVSDFLNEFLILPITSTNKPDFEWMSAYIKAVKADYLEQKELSNQREIKDYLTAGKVDSMDVTDADRQFLREFEKLPRHKFKVGELFVPTNPKRYDLKISDIIDNNGNTTVISSTTVNQGIKGYSSMTPLVKANKIVYSDAVGPSMMFYQECDFIADAHVKYLEPKFVVNMSKNMALYLITCIQKSTFGVYSYGNKYNNAAVNNTTVELPVIANDEVDVQSIEKYMQIQIKLTIAKRKSYLDHELELMKQV